MNRYKKDTDSGPGFYVKTAICPPFSGAGWLAFAEDPHKVELPDTFSPLLQVEFPP